MVRYILCVALLFVAVVTQAADALPTQPETFDVNRHTAYLYAAPKPAPGKPWIWYAPTLKGLSLAKRKLYFETFLNAGISLAGFDLGEVRGSPRSNEQFTLFYDEMVKRGWSAKPILLGQSRGGLMMLSWATQHPDKLQALVGIYPVFNLESWPLKNSKAATLADYQLTEDELRAKLAELNPVNHLKGLLEKKVPLFVVHGDNDVVVPHRDNTLLVKDRYEAGGGSIAVKIIPGEGHQELPVFFECQELIDFVLKQAQDVKAADAASPAKKRVVVLSSAADPGANTSQGLYIKILREAGFDARAINAEEVREKKLEGVDIFIIGGGSGTAFNKSLGPEGGKVVQDFMRRGGGALASCAGGYSFVKGHNEALKYIELAQARCIDYENNRWARGAAEVAITPADNHFAPLKMYYANGPLWEIEKDQGADKTVALATFKDDVKREGDAGGVMPGTPAILGGTYGDGRFVLFSAHPEFHSKLGNNPAIVDAAHWVVRGKLKPEEKIEWKEVFPSYSKEH